MDRLSEHANEPLRSGDLSNSKGTQKRAGVGDRSAHVTGSQRANHFADLSVRTSASHRTAHSRASLYTVDGEPELTFPADITVLGVFDPSLSRAAEASRRRPSAASYHPPPAVAVPPITAAKARSAAVDAPSSPHNLWPAVPVGTPQSPRQQPPSQLPACAESEAAAAVSPTVQRSTTADVTLPPTPPESTVLHGSSLSGCTGSDPLGAPLLDLLHPRGGSECFIRRAAETAAAAAAVSAATTAAAGGSAARQAPAAAPAAALLAAAKAAGGAAAAAAPGSGEMAPRVRPARQATPYAGRAASGWEEDARDPMSLYYDPRLDARPAPCHAGAASAPAPAPQLGGPQPPDRAHAHAYPSVDTHAQPHAAQRTARRQDSADGACLPEASGVRPASAALPPPAVGAAAAPSPAPAGASAALAHVSMSVPGLGAVSIPLLESAAAAAESAAAAAAAAAAAEGGQGVMLLAVKLPPDTGPPSPSLYGKRRPLGVRLRGAARAYGAKWRGVGDTLLPRDAPHDCAWAWLGACLSIALVAALNQYLSPEVDLPLMVASFGATAVLLFGVTNSKLGQPRNCMGGQVLSAVVGCAVRVAFGTGSTAAQLRWLSSALGMSSALLAMMLTRTTHPPGGASALIAASAAHIGADNWYGFKFVLTVFFGSAIMMLMSLLVNNLAPRRRYPTYWLGA